MKEMKKYTLILAACCIAFASCDRISIDESIDSAPEVTSFSPKSAPAGAEVIVLGEHLSDVVSAKIGNTPVSIIQKVSDSRLSIRVSQEVTSGKITLTNKVGTGSSAESFTCSFAVPTLTASLIQKQADMGDLVLLNGEHLNSAKAVLFTAEGHDTPHEAAIQTQSDNEIVVKVPYVEDGNARITLRYFNGSADVDTDRSTAPQITVIRYVPRFDEYTLEQTAVGKSIVLTGEYLNNIDRVTVGEFEAPIFKEGGKLTFTVPAGDFQDGQTTVALKAWYFENNESITLSDEFIVYVPFVKYWENVKTWAQGRTEENEYVSFFSPETGIAYENSKWKTDLDPVALKYQNSQWGSANVPKPGVVSDEDYNSVVPYFFISAVSGNVLQINSPANSNSQLKNFYISFTGTPANDFRVPGNGNNMPGTPILGFRYLNPTSEVAAETALIEKVLNGQIENINEALFPIDVEAQTIAGISVSSMAGAIKSDKWCTRQTTSLEAEKGYKTDAIFLVAYYSNNGYVKETPANNIKRLGILHITEIDWGIYNSQNYGSSRITYNFHWQKYDYDYSKL